MEAVHAWNQVREIAHHQEMASEALGMLRENSLCPSSTPECELTDNDLAEVTYSEFSQNCSLFYRGCIPDLRRKVSNWDIVVGDTLYNSKNLEPQDMVYGTLSEELHYVTSVAMEVLRKEISDVELHNIANVYIRYKGTVGREYILDLELIRTAEGRNRGSFERRVSLVLPHQPDMVFMNDNSTIGNTSEIVINIITPLDELNRRKVSRFQRFYYGLCIKKKLNCRILYVFYTDSTRNVRFMKDYLVRYARKYPLFKYEILIGIGKFDKTKAYNLGASILKDDELMLIADLELGMADDFLNRCRQNAIRGHRIYYPDIFKYYDMHYIYRGRWRPKHFDYIRQHGHWTKHNTICLYKSDFTTIGGFATVQKWEIESYSLRYLLKGGLEVIQAPDAGVSHWYEERTCDSSLPPAKFSNCLTRRKDDLADRTNLANYVLALERRCRVKKGVPSKTL